MFLFYLLSTVLYTPPKGDKISTCVKKYFYTKKDNELVKVWVFFTDKGIFTEKDYKIAILKQENLLTQRARTRLLKIKKEGELCDFSDLPVYKNYIEEIKLLGCRLQSISKWLNGATFITEVRKIKDIANLPYVRKIDKVKVFQVNADYEIKKLKNSKIEIFEGIRYGHSERQLKQLNIIKAHSKGYTGKDVLIGILDTGFEWRDNSIFEGINVIAEYDFIGNDTFTGWDPHQIDTVFIKGSLQTFKEHPDQINHGTGMLCLIGGRVGGFYIGAAFNASFALAKTELLYNEITGKQDIIAEEDWWIRGIEWLDSIGVDIISNSLGYKFWYDPNDSTPNFAYKHLDGKHYRISKVASTLWQKNILLVTAMGNIRGGASPDTAIVAPADADSIIAVGGVDTLGNWMYSPGVGSAKGPRCDGAIKPEVCGPWFGEYRLPEPGTNNFIDVKTQGTSVATALVAGACALVKEAHPKWSAMKIREAIMKTASRANNPNDTIGYGIVDAYKAIFYKDPEVKPPPLTKSRIISIHPNPFNIIKDKEIYISYLLLNNVIPYIAIYTLSGKKVWEYLPQDAQPMGEHKTPPWDGKMANGEYISTGVYLCVLRASPDRDVKKFVVIR